MVVHDELKSQPCLTIHYTHNETLKGLRCCELPESVQTHSTWCQKWKTGKPTLAPSVTENHVVVAILEPTDQSQPSPTIFIILITRIWKGCDVGVFVNHFETTQSWCETLGLGAKKMSPPTSQKAGCGDCYT